MLVGPMVPEVEQDETTADFFDLSENNRNAFAGGGRSSTTSGSIMAFRGRSSTMTSSHQSKNKAISLDSLNQVSDSIEAKYRELKLKMEEAKQQF